MKKVAIVPLILVDNDGEGRFVEAGAQMGALVFGVFDAAGNGGSKENTFGNCLKLEDLDACGFELSSFSNDLLQDNVMAILSSILKRAFDEYAGETRVKHVSPGCLTERETEILKLIAKGNTNKKIAAKLFLSVKTVETHRRNIYRKLNTHNCTLATAYAVRNGIV